MEIVLSKSLTAKEYHQMISDYYANTYGLVEVSANTTCTPYHPSLFDTIGRANSNSNLINIVTSVSGILRENGEEFSFCHELSHSDLEEILCARFSDYTVDDFSVQSRPAFSIFSENGFKEKFLGIDIQLHKNIKNHLIQK